MSITLFFLLVYIFEINHIILVIKNFGLICSPGKPKFNDSTVELSYKKEYGAQTATTFVAGADLLEADNKTEESEDADGNSCFELDIQRP